MSFFPPRPASATLRPASSRAAGYHRRVTGTRSRRVFARALLLSTGLALACRTAAPRAATETPEAGAAPRVLIGAVRWYVDYESAVEIAREQDKALWVHFGENPG